MTEGANRSAAAVDPLASGIPDRRLDRALQWIARVAVRTFYRRIEVRGLAHLPSDGPVVVVANHGNSLVDPMLVFACLGRRSLFLAKSTLWEHPFGRIVVGLGPAIPVYRRSDAGVDPAQNERTFETCHRALAEGLAIALFPEGLSHLEPALQPLKTGAARIVLEAERRFGPLPTTIVPVGLNFESRDRFRSSALVEVGPPIDPGPAYARYASEPREAVRALTDEIDEGLRAVTLNFATWRDAELLARAAELYTAPAPDVPRRPGLAATFSTRKELLSSYRRLRERHPAELASLAGAVDDYDRLLTAAGVSDTQVASSYPKASILRFLLHSSTVILLWLPLAVAGYLLNFLPYQVPKAVVRILRRPIVEHATYKLLSSVVVFPLVWLAQAVLLGYRFGWPWGAASFFLAPLGGYAALRFRESTRRLVEEARAYLVLATRRRVHHELLARRADILEQMQRLATIDDAPA